MLPASHRIDRVKKALHTLEADIPFLNVRVRDLSMERQRSARQFAESLIHHTRVELDQLLQERPAPDSECGEDPCEPAD